MKAPTLHISAAFGEIAETVLMPGDPNRAEYISMRFLKEAQAINISYGPIGFTGYYKGKKVSVISSGMGIPATLVYASELYGAYGVKQIIRIGTAGALQEKINLMDIVASLSCSTDSCIARSYQFPGTIAPSADWSLLLQAHKIASKLDINLHIGPTMCTDVLFDDTGRSNKSLYSMGLLASEMETAGLYVAAMRSGNRALSLMTVVSSEFTGECISAQVRERGLDKMIVLALETAVN